MLQFRDFTPEVISDGFFSDKQLESLTEKLHEANAWIEEARVDVINVETVVLPNIHKEEGSQDVQLRTSGEFSTQWYQFLRVWYRE